MNITYWSDIACPFCYIGATRMKRAMKAVGLNPNDLKMRAFQLNPYAPQETTENMLTQFATSHHMSKEDAQSQFDYIASMGEKEGLHIDMAGAIPTNTMLAHRLIKWAETQLSKDKLQELISALYQLYFERHVSIASKDELIRVASAFGLPAASTLNFLDSNQFEAEVKADMNLAYQSGVSGAPFFVLNQKYGISGAQPYEYMETALKQVLAEERKKSNDEN